MIVPNTQRVLIKPLLMNELKSGIVISGQIEAGENLLFGEIVDGGDTKFVKGTHVYFSKYSAVNVIDFQSVLDGRVSLSEAQKDSLVIVAQDDVMAHDDSKIPAIA